MARLFIWRLGYGLLLTLLVVATAYIFYVSQYPQRAQHTLRFLVAGLPVGLLVAALVMMKSRLAALMALASLGYLCLIAAGYRGFDRLFEGYVATGVGATVGFVWPLLIQLGHRCTVQLREEQRPESSRG